MGDLSSEKEQAKLASLESNLNDLQTRLEALQHEAVALWDEAEPLLKHAQGLGRPMVRARVEELNRDAVACQRYMAGLPPAAWAPWSSPVWTSGEPLKPETLWSVRYATLKEANPFSGETGWSGAAVLDLFDAKSAVMVTCDEETRAAARGVIQSIILRAAVAMPAELSFTLIDPVGLGAAFPMRSLLPRVRRTGRTVSDELAEVVEEIRRINETVVGHEARFADLPPERWAGETFELIVVMDYPNAYKRDPRALELIWRIGQAGPRAGRHLLFEYLNNDATIGQDLEPFGDGLGRTATFLWGDHVEGDVPPPAELQKRLLTAAATTKARPAGGDWNAQVRPEAWFASTSERLVETPVGERLRLWFGDGLDGQPSAHAMLAGQTGSGKSFLLHVLITGLAARYAPSELQFVLVDGKQGVEFEAYRTLPHARVVCLRTSPAIARSVLEDFIAEMEDRYQKFQQAGVVKLEDYRRKTGQPMPRLLMVVDEFQQLLEGDSDRGAQMLSRMLEKGRAAGTHLVLGSQTFDVRGFPSSALAHVHLRASLSLAVDYVQGLAAFGSEGKKLIRDLPSSGHAVINDESGRDGANARGAVARLEGGVAPVVAEIVKAAGGAGQGIVLSGNDASLLSENPFVTAWRQTPPSSAELQETARRGVRAGGFGLAAWSGGDHPFPLWLGRKFDVRGHLPVVLRRAPAQNLLVLGAQTATRLAMLANALAALRTMVPASSLEVLLLDGLGDGQPGSGLLAEGLTVLQRTGATVMRSSRNGAGAALESLAAPPANGVSRLVILSEPEYFAELASGGPYAGPAAGPAKAFKELLRSGPAAGTHVIVTSSGTGTLASVVHPSREASLFNHRVVQQCSEEESMTLFASLAATRIQEQTNHPMAALYADMTQGVRAAQLFKSYGPADASAEELRGVFAGLFEEAGA